MSASHAKDMGETVQRLTQARGLHQSAAQIAQQNKAQDVADQGALQAQNDAVKGTGSANPAEGQFPELGQPHLVLASPAGIETTTFEAKPWTKKY